VGGWDDVLGPGVRERLVHRRLRAGRNSVREQQRGDMPVGRHLGQQHDLRQLGVCDGIVHGCVHARLGSMFGQLGYPDVQPDGRLEPPRDLHEPSVREQRVCGRLFAGRDALLQQQHSDV